MNTSCAQWQRSQLSNRLIDAKGSISFQGDKSCQSFYSQGIIDDVIGSLLQGKMEQHLRNIYDDFL